VRGRKSTSKFYQNLRYQSHMFRGVKSQQGVGKLFYFLKDKKKKKNLWKYDKEVFCEIQMFEE